MGCHALTQTFTTWIMFDGSQMTDQKASLLVAVGLAVVSPLEGDSPR